MSRLTDLIGRLRDSDPALAADISREVEVLGQRRAFGLNFERHVPETVQLPQRRVRRGDKVVFLPERGADKDSVDGRVWLVTGFEGKGANREALLVPSTTGDEPSEETKRLVADLAVVAEFRDPIYPGLVSTGKVERGADKPFHSVINGENYHALEALRFAYEGAVDCIYIDPPYNTRDKDWKYNNDYVDNDDRYRHSKWLAMMERRLRSAKSLLRPEKSVLIVAIDEKEHLRLGLLLEQIFPDARIQMISTLVNPANQARGDAFGRNDEYLFFAMFGEAAPERLLLSREWVSNKGRTFTGTARWDLLRRSGTNAERSHSPGCFYPVYIDPEVPRIADVGEPVPPGKSTAPKKRGMDCVLPIRKDKSEGVWQLAPETLKQYIGQGRVRIGGSKKKGFVIYYLKPGEYKKVVDGDYPVLGHRPDGSLDIGETDGEAGIVAAPTTQWRISSHDATQYGTRLLKDLLPGRDFPFPKSLYAVEDALRFFVTGNPNAVILDFFAGSGTTTHAVARLNQEDEGTRVSISVTNNEVSAKEAAELEKKKLRPGDPEWEASGICEYITKPRLEAAFTGDTPDGTPIAGSYKFRAEGPMADGLAENVEFFNLTYEDAARVRHGLGFGEIAPLLWLRAGSRGRQVLNTNDTFEMADTYGVLFNVDAAAGFVEAVEAAGEARVAYVVTDDEGQFQTVASQLPSRVEAVRLYEAYLDNARIGPRS